MLKNNYKVLGLEPGASRERVKTAFRRLTMKYHPDRIHGNRHAEQRFKLICRAYRQLLLENYIEKNGADSAAASELMDLWSQGVGPESDAEGPATSWPLAASDQPLHGEDHRQHRDTRPDGYNSRFSTGFDKDKNVGKIRA